MAASVIFGRDRDLLLRVSLLLVPVVLEGPLRKSEMELSKGDESELGRQGSQ